MTRHCTTLPMQNCKPYHMLPPPPSTHEKEESVHGSSIKGTHKTRPYSVFKWSSETPPKKVSSAPAHQNIWSYFIGSFFR